MVTRPRRQRALSVQQPWAWLLLHGKDVENRTWPTRWRGRLWVHASSRLDRKGLWALEDAGVALPPVADLPRGALVGAVELLGCVQDSPSRWAVPGQWHWLIGRSWELPQPIPLPGQLGLFPVDHAFPTKTAQDILR